MQDGGEDSFSLTPGPKSGEIGAFMNDLYDKYISQGIPVVIGEFGARDKRGNTQARVDFAAWYAADAHSRGMPVCWWDNNVFTGSGERFGLLRRADCAWPCPQIVEALMRYGR